MVTTQIYPICDDVRKEGRVGVVIPNSETKSAYFLSTSLNRLMITFKQRKKPPLWSGVSMYY